MTKVCVLGSGSWGTALSILLADKCYNINLWGRNKEHLNTIEKTRENTKYLPGIKLPSNIKIVYDISEALQGCSYILIVVSSKAVREIAGNISKYIKGDEIVINCAKGIEYLTLKRMSQVIEEVIPDINKNIAVLSGPSHAEEVGKRLPTTSVVSAHKREVAENVQKLFMAPRFRVYTNPDLIGVELGGASKNIIALAAGISDGLGFGDNTKAALMTRGIAEITRLGMAMGADPLTFAGLSGIGDLIVTCTSMHSRNRRAGILLGQGKALNEVLEGMGMVVEGIGTTKAAYMLADKYNIEMPITRELYSVIFEGKDPMEGVSNLMLRMMTQETEEISNNVKWNL